MDLALCLLSLVENQIRYENANNLGHDLSGLFLNLLKLEIIYFSRIQLGWPKVSLVTYLVEKREYSNNKDGLRIFVHFFWDVLTAMKIEE